MPGLQFISNQSLLSEDLSRPHPEWDKVASKQSALDAIAEGIYQLPITEFRQVPYRPPPLPNGSPLPGQDIRIREEEFLSRDGTMIKSRIYEPINFIGDRLLFFNVHGGGWTVGSPETEEAQNRFITVKCQAVVCSVDYRRAPEFPFPFALNDSIDALLWCKSNATKLGIDPKKIIIGGGSAGANVCAAIAQIFRDNGTAGIIGQVLNIPVTCHPAHFPTDKYDFESYITNAESPIVNASRMRKFWNNYLPGAESDPRANPLLKPSLENLPPTLIQVAGMDPLRDEGLAYAKALQSNGVDVTLKVYAGMPHAFYIYPEMKSSIDYFQTMIDWICRR